MSFAGTSALLVGVPEEALPGVEMPAVVTDFGKAVERTVNVDIRGVKW